MNPTQSYPQRRIRFLNRLLVFIAIFAVVDVVWILFSSGRPNRQLPIGPIFTLLALIFCTLSVIMQIRDLKRKMALPPTPPPKKPSHEAQARNDKLANALDHMAESDSRDAP